ncbi:MAG: pyridoxamine 5'-phosphate oxidase family protein [Mogibacterium sp.]|nr:pyridoxamine 5'-phosphate oxidase family protein [Mogibacterium sp.]
MFRKMRRFKQELPEERVREVLRDGMRANVAVLGDDGYPYTYPTNYYYDEEQHVIYFHGAKEGHKIDAIRHCDKATFNVYLETELDAKGKAWYVDSVIAFGRMKFVEDEDEKLKALQGLGYKYPVYTKEEADEAIRKGGGRAQCLRFEIEHATCKHVHEE